MDDFSQSWKALPWKKFQKHVFNIQKRIFEAIRTSDYRRAKNLQKLLLISRAARFLAVRKIIQLNKGKKTAGIDKKTQKHYNFKKRFELVEMLATKRWEHQRIRRIEIPKKDGRSRKLGIPTIQDRVWQELTRMAIEPAHEATFHSKSYGFRPGRSTQDAQKIVFQNLRSSSNGIDKRVLSLDIKACFDKISHDSILKKVICPGHVKENIHRCLNSGTDLKFQHDENEGKGTQQGGVISPLLANIALDGIEGLHKDYRVDKGIRYADDILYILKPEDDVNKIMSKVVSFLSERGLEVNKTKTKLYKSTDGFDYLGWHFVVTKQGKFKCMPSKDNYQSFRKKVKSIVNCSNIGSKVKAKKLAPVIRGWRNYHRYCDMSKHPLWDMTHRAYTVFNKEEKNDRYSSKKLIKQAFPAVTWAVNKHINVKGNKSPYDGDIVYWSKRNSNKYNSYTAKALKKQCHKCDSCNLSFIDNEPVHLHHKDGNHSNWKANNLCAVHQSCHQYIHIK